MISLFLSHSKWVEFGSCVGIVSKLPIKVKVEGDGTGLNWLMPIEWVVQYAPQTADDRKA